MVRLIKHFSLFLFAFTLSCAPIIERSQTEYSWLSKILAGQSSTVLSTTTPTTPTNPVTNPTTPTVIPFSLTYALSQNVFPTNTAITELLPAVTGTMTSCAVTPSLPTGLVFDTTTCSITGTPTTQTGPTTYTISATGTTGNASANISIRISSTTAFRVFGQLGNLTASALNNGGISANSLAQPSSIGSDGAGNIVIADYNNRRILYYPFANIAAGGNITATKVYGQFGDFTCVANFNNGACGASTPSASNMGAPQSVTMDKNGNVYAEAGSRVLFFSSNASLPASRVYGQVTSTNFTCSVANNNGSCVSGSPTASANTLAGVQQMIVDSSDGIYICDNVNHRVLYYPNGNTTASRVYGQLGSFTTGTPNNGGITANSLNSPAGVALDSTGNLYIADQSNHRILFYPAGTTTATIVYGQSGNFTTSSIGTTASTFNQPWGISLDQYDNLYVSDFGNNRLLYFPKSSTTATRVYGQLGNFTSATPNNGGVTANSMSGIHSVHVDLFGNVYVVDTNNNRVVMY